MRIDQGRTDQIAGSVDHFFRFDPVQPACRRNPISADTDIGHGSIRQRAALNDQIEHQRSPLLNGTIRAAGTSARRDITMRARIDNT